MWKDLLLSHSGKWVAGISLLPFLFMYRVLRNKNAV